MLADRLYGESDAFITELRALGLSFVVAIRGNHKVWVKNGTRQRQTRWRTFERLFSDGSSQTRYLSEIVFGKRGTLRYYWVTTDPLTLPTDTTYLLMTNLQGDVRHKLGNAYGLRTWIEYGFKHIKNELGWADYRLTDYAAIERWWELVFSTYLMVSLYSPALQTSASTLKPLDTSTVKRHPRWVVSAGWKHTLNNLRLLIQPFLCLWMVLPWLSVFSLPALAHHLQCLVACINSSTYPLLTKEG